MSEFHMIVRPARAQLPVGANKVCGRFGRSSVTSSAQESYARLREQQCVAVESMITPSESSDPLPQTPDPLSSCETGKLGDPIAESRLQEEFPFL